MASYVLDASALLAVIHREPGEDIVRRNSLGSIASAVNIAEAGAHLADRSEDEATLRSYIEIAGIEIEPFDAELAFISAALRTATRSQGLSLGDRACLALARRRRLPVLTADTAWARLSIGVEIELIRRRST
jgi:PIN domain nuclease of toxin-antitoxin system